jgi:NAD(P)-dependent dehydrogenase (short-subunit alcohol dehydrogenase family)
MIQPGSVALVTGGSRGLGRAIAGRLVSDGFDVVLTARESAALADAVAELQGLRRRADQEMAWFPLDVSRPEEVARVVGEIESRFGHIDVLVCNAGVYGPKGRVEDCDWTDWVQAIEINLLGTVLCCKAVVPIMRRQRSGRIVILSGGGATQPLPYLSAYAASKAAVVRFSETLAKEVQENGITVNAVAPGSLNTRLLDEVIDAGPDKVGPAFYDRAVRQKSEGGTPLEVGADLVAFLASPASNGVTGRLLAAVWDNWRALPEQRERLADSDVFTLRRIVPSDRGWAEQ